MSRKQWRPILSDMQVQKLADLIGDLGQVMVASIVVPALFDKGSFLSSSIERARRIDVLDKCHCPVERNKK